MARLLIICLLMLLNNLVWLVIGSISAEEKLLRELLDVSVYDLGTRPHGVDSKDGPCVVEIDMLLNSVGPVSSLNMELTTNFYLRQEWIDQRLRYNATEVGSETILISHHFLEKMWRPDLFFTMGVESYLHHLTTPNVLIRLWPNGLILFSQRLTSTMKCFMDLSNFPHDRQNCHSSMMSYGFTTEDILFKWSSKRQATSVLPSAYLAEFTLSTVRASDCTQTFATGTFTCLEAVLTLDREIGFYLTQTYIPSVLIVMLSWAAFWIDHEAVPARISVGLLTVLTITTQSTGARSQLPRVSYIKAIDVWMSANLIFVFSAYMEYAVVTVMSRRYKKKMRNKLETDSQRTDSVNTDSESMEMGENGALAHLRRIPVVLTTTLPPLVSGNLQQPQPHLQQQQYHRSQQQQQRQQQNHEHLPRSGNKGRENTKKKRRKFSVLSQKKKSLIFKRNFGRRVDFHSRYTFPLSYLLFNIIYWSTYLTKE